MTSSTLHPPLLHAPSLHVPSLHVPIDEVRRLYAAADFAGAAEAGWALLRQAPCDATVLNVLALVEHARGNLAAGIVLLRRATRASPNSHALWNDLGNLYFSSGAMEEAEKAYQKALELDPNCAEAYSNLAVISLKRNAHAAARTLLEKALALRPHYPEALYNLGNALSGLGKFKKALRRYEQAQEVSPEHPGTHFNLGITRLVLGDMAGGWPGWEWRWRSTLAPFKRDFSQPEWKGEPLHGRRLLLYAEQGIGDTLQFLRYVPLVAARGAEIVLEVQAPLVQLLQGDPRVTQLIARGEELAQFDVQCSLMSLGSIFRTTLATIPPVRLPFHELETVLPPSSQLTSAPFRVGLVWAGNPTHVRDADRSMPLLALAPLFGLKNVDWFSLQKGKAADELSAANAVDCSLARITDLAENFADYADTAKAVQALDLVITVDTSVAHLAGAMGKPVWILLPAVPDWRWLLKRRDSPWYPSARLFRQSEPGDWAGVIANVKQELKARTLQCVP